MIEELIEVAENEIGTKEPSGDDKYIAHYNRVAKANFNMNVAWCAIFITWCRDKAGIDKSIIPTFASCDVGMNWFKKRGLFKVGCAYGGSYNPKRGDIVFFSSKYDQKDSTHVGIVTKLSGNTVCTIEGNTNNKVAARSYSKASKYILGYATPEYKEKVYIVKKGDNLWKIAKKMLGDGAKYPEIMALNSLDHTIIRPGDKLYMPF